MLDSDKNESLTLEEIQGTLGSIYKEKMDLNSSLNDLSHALGERWFFYFILTLKSVFLNITHCINSIHTLRCLVGNGTDNSPPQLIP